MTMSKNEVNMKDPLRWIMEITLVLALALFSGHCSEFNSFSPKQTTTELAEIRSSYSKKTSCFKKTFINRDNSFQHAFNLTRSFTSSLWQYDNILRSKFRDNFRMLALLKHRNKTFQSNHNSNDSCEESDTDESKG